jgi:hypothetical protein
VLLHSGRRSGKEYITPIVAVRENSSFVIPLPYGLQVDWFKNVMAAGSCELIYHGKMYHASKPEMISSNEGIEVFAGWVQARLRRLNTEYLLRLREPSALVQRGPGNTAPVSVCSSAHWRCLHPFGG